MTRRASVSKVQQVLGSLWDGSTDLEPFMSAAEALTDWLASEDGGDQLNATLLTEIEAYLAAHFYQATDLPLQAERVGAATATYQGRTGYGLSATQHGQRAGAAWLGKTESEQLTYDERN